MKPGTPVDGVSAAHGRMKEDKSVDADLDRLDLTLRHYKEKIAGDPDDPAFDDPTKFIGPVYDRETAERLAAEKGWAIKQDGDKWRRVVASPLPKRIFEIRPIQWLLERGAVVVCTGGGGIPTMYEKGTRRLVGAEVVIDKDRASALLAAQLGADLFVMATDVDAVYTGFGTPDQKPIGHTTPSRHRGHEAAGGLDGTESRGGRHLRAGNWQARRDRHAGGPARRRGGDQGDADRTGQGWGAGG